MFQTLVWRRVSFKGWGEGTAKCLSVARTGSDIPSLRPPTVNEELSAAVYR